MAHQRDLLDALLTGRLPRRIRGSGLPRFGEGTFPTDFDLDSNGDPSDRILEEIGMICARDAPRWLRRIFADQYAQMSCYVSMKIEQCMTGCGQVGVRLSFSTGGHSSSETIIDAVLRNVWLRSYLESERRGGHYTMVVPMKDPE